MPHSLGWFYAAVTEYLGFEAYDGEYKVMGLAAYGKHDDDLHGKIRRVLAPADDGIEYRLDPSFIHYGARTWSERFTDALPVLFGRPRRLPQEPIEPWHHDLAFAAQQALEAAVERLVRWGMDAVGTGNLCIGGGVGLNVKMNTRLFELASVERIFAQPLCADGGAAAGAALGACWEATGARPKPLGSLALGNGQSDEAIEAALKLCGLPYERPADIARATAEALAKGQVVGWFQGRMEAGPRALGQRSILADPRREDARDQVNEVIKYREFWRPFCPSMLAEAADRYLVDYDDGRFMIVAFKATDALKRDAPAVVHVDGTVRVQLVQREVLPLYHDLISADRRAGPAQHLLQRQGRAGGLDHQRRDQDLLFHRHGRIGRRRLPDPQRRITHRGPDVSNNRVLIIAPHPDDEILGAGGTIARFADGGAQVTVLTVAAHMPPLYDEAVHRQTIDEARKAHAMVGVKDSVFLDIPAVFVRDQPTHELNQKISAVVQQTRPAIVLMPFPDRHIDHRVIFDAAMVVTRPVGVGAEIGLVAAYETLSETHWNAPHGGHNRDHRAQA
jgi:hypothetical protein